MVIRIMICMVICIVIYRVFSTPDARCSERQCVTLFFVVSPSESMTFYVSVQFECSWNITILIH